MCHVVVQNESDSSYYLNASFETPRPLKKEEKCVSGKLSRTPLELVEQGAANNGRAGLGLTKAFLWDFAVELLGDDFTSILILQARENLTEDTEGRRDDARGVARVGALLDDLDLQNSSNQTTQGGGDPELVISTAARIKADDQVGNTNAGLEVLNVERQIGRAALLASLDD